MLLFEVNRATEYRLAKNHRRFGLTDYWIVKLDFAGNIEWQKTLGGNRAESFGDLIETADGGYIVTGSSESGISGNKTEPSKGPFDWWIVKLDQLGNIQWQKTIGGSSGDYSASRILETTDGNYIIAGDSQSSISGDKTETREGHLIFGLLKSIR